eukprot:10792944-Prorocentrum_lima.AAC.1
MCKFWPRSSVGHREIAGTACAAFSQLGQRKGWIHASSLLCLVWVHLMKAIKPGITIHENSPISPASIS